MNKYFVLLAPLLGWLVAQAIKYIITLRKDGLQIRDLYSSGGFPSSHTSSIVALSTYIGATDGWTSSIFALSAVIAGIVMYDAVGVRRSNGEHTNILMGLLKKEGETKKIKNLTLAFGHTPLEVMGGFILGSLIGLTLAYI